MTSEPIGTRRPTLRHPGPVTDADLASMSPRELAALFAIRVGADPREPVRCADTVDPAALAIAESERPA